MDVLKNSDILYKKSDLPDLCVGDTVRVILYLELPKKSESDDKKEKELN